MTDDLSMKAAEYALGTLDADERADFARLLAGDAALQALVRDWEERLAPMAGVAPVAEPSPSLWDRIEREVEAIASGGNVVTLRRSVNRWRTATAFAGALAACLAIVAVVRGPGSEVEPTAPRQHVAQVAPSQGQGASGAGAGPQGVPVPASSTPVNRTAPVVASNAGNGVETASAARPQGTGSVSLAAGARDSGSISVDAGAAVRPQPERQRTGFLAALTPNGGQGDLIVRVDQNAGTLSAYRSGPDALGGKPVELWIIEQDRPPQPIGLLTGDSRSFQLPTGLPLEGAEVAASVESGELGPDARPSGAFVFRGRLVRE